MVLTEMYLPAWFLLKSLGYQTVYSFYQLGSVCADNIQLISETN